MKGFLDRIEDGRTAVILLEDEQKELKISMDELPQGSKENTWLIIEQRGISYKVIAIDEEKTKEEDERSSELMEKLRAKSKGSKFKKN